MGVNNCALISMAQGCKNRVSAWPVSAVRTTENEYTGVHADNQVLPTFEILILAYILLFLWRVVKTHHMHCIIQRHDKINKTFNNVTAKPTFFFGVRTTKYSVRTTIFWKVVVLRTTTFWSDFYGPVASWKHFWSWSWRYTLHLLISLW